MTTTINEAKLENHGVIDNYDDVCPVHDTPAKKSYTFGSTMSAETTVVVHRGCQCAVAIGHDPIGTLPDYMTYHTDFNSAAGVGKLRAASAAAKYR